MTLSADVMAGKERRRQLGQEGILTYLDVIMPMEYTYFAGFKGDEEVKELVDQLRQQFPNKKLTPIFRAWVCKGKKDGCSIYEKPEDTIKSIEVSVRAARQLDIQGVALFTYESFLSETGINILKGFIKDTKW